MLMSIVRPPPKRHLPPNHPALIRLLSPCASLVFPRVPHSRAALATRTRRVPNCGGHLYEVTCHAEACATASDPLQPPNSVALCGPTVSVPELVALARGLSKSKLNASTTTVTTCTNLVLRGGLHDHLRGFTPHVSATLTALSDVQGRVRVSVCSHGTATAPTTAGHHHRATVELKVVLLGGETHVSSTRLHRGHVCLLATVSEHADSPTLQGARAHMKNSGRYRPRQKFSTGGVRWLWHRKMGKPLTCGRTVYSYGVIRFFSTHANCVATSIHDLIHEAALTTAGCNLDLTLLPSITCTVRSIRSVRSSWSSRSIRSTLV